MNKISRCQLRCLALLITFMCSSAVVFGQGKTITIKERNKPLATLIQMIKEQSGVKLFYSNEDLNLKELKNIDVKQMKVIDVLSALLGKGYHFEEITPGTISISKSTTKQPSGNIRVRGTIQSEDGQFLESVSVHVKKRKRTAISDANGRFDIIAQKNDTLLFSYVGAIALQLPLAEKDTVLSVRMKGVNGALQDVVVTGYQTLNRKDIAGAIASVDMRDLNQTGSMSIDQMIQGKIAGMTVTNVIGNPGAPPKIRIRGTSSITGDQEPIWVIDGVIWEEPIAIRNRDLASADQTTLLNLVGGSVAGLNPKDIASIDVLKDASATAIYGVRAANGVIVVTTKRGVSGTARVNYSTDLQIRTKPGYGNLSMMSAGQRLQMSEELFGANVLLPTRSNRVGWEGAYMDLLNKRVDHDGFQNRIQQLSDMNTDWFDVLFRNAFSQNHSISMSGGTDKLNYYLSSNYYDEKSNAKGVGLTRYGTTLRINNQISKRLSADLKLGINIRDNKSFHSSINPYDYAVNTSRAVPVYEANGSPFFYETGTASFSKGFLMYNVLNELENTGNKARVKDINAQLNLRYAISDAFRWETLVSYNTQTSATEDWSTDRSYYAAVLRGYNYGEYNPESSTYKLSKLPFGGTLGTNDIDAFNYTVRNSLFYDKEFNGVHRLSVVAGNEIRSVQYKGRNQMQYGYFRDRGQVVVTPTNEGYFSELSAGRGVYYRPSNTISNYLSFYAIANYKYNEKYLLTASIRNDGSNMFGSNKTYRYTPVWSVAGKWILSNEEFIGKSDLLSHLALRTSYGWQGNIRSDASPSLVVNQNAVDPATGKYSSTLKYLPNPGLRWEKNVTFDAGAEFGFFQDRINVTVDYYNRSGKDLIINQVVPLVNGRDAVLVNGGNMYNRGWELSLSAYPFRSNEFSWRTTINTAQNRNRITKANVTDQAVSDKYEGKAVISGDQYGSLYSYKFMGLNEFGWPTFLNNDGTSGHMTTQTQAVMVNSGSFNPKVSGGWDNSFRYKDFTLGVSLAFNFGAFKRLPGYYKSNTTAFPFEVTQNFPEEYSRRWIRSGDQFNTNLPVLMDVLQLTQGKAAPNNYATPNGHVYASQGGVHMHTLYNYSDVRIVKADYVRVQALNLNYNISQKLLNRTPISALSVNFSAQNLWFWAADKSKLNGRDPEIIDQPGALPIPKVFSLGINASF